MAVKNPYHSIDVPRAHPLRRPGSMGRRLFAVLVLSALAVGCGSRGASDSPAKIIAEINAKKSAALAHFENGDYNGAKELLQPLATRKVGDPQVYSMLARVQWRLGEHDDAISNYESAMRLDYYDPITHMELAQLLVEIGKIGRALTEFELAVQYSERDPLPHYNYGLALYQLKRRNDAVTQWEIAYSLDPGNPKHAEAMGIGLSGDDDEAARKHFEKAIELGADDPSFHNNYGLFLQRLGDYEGAESEFQRSLEQDPANPTYRFNLGLLFLASRNFAAAVTLWKNLHTESPAEPAYRIYLARAYLESGRFRSVIDVLTEWLARVEENPALGRSSIDVEGGRLPALDEAHDLLAMAYRGVGDLEKAGEYMRKALELQPDNVVHLINYGVILAESGKIPEARAQWERVLEIDPENATARENLSAFEP
ncbi:MAG: tetratricopeptide repeat protein [Candidatus Latescibacterota bacterium]|nr:MAG: tetratricopeptide repeat protein [Candidatus Latescibacterota bacterium]